MNTYTKMANPQDRTPVIDQIVPWDADFAVVDVRTGEVVLCILPENPTCMFCCGTGIYKGEVCRRCGGAGQPGTGVAVRMLSRETVWTARGNGVEVVYRVPCGREYPVQCWTPEQLYREHGRCLPCRVLAGKSKASVMTQDDAALLWTRGIYGKRSKTGNMRSTEGGYLLHYGTIEGVRTTEGKVIRSTQCWSAGFASCARFHADHHLPLSTLDEVLRPENLAWGSSDLGAIEVLDVQEGENWQETVLFRFGDRLFLFGQDGRAPFLCELPRNGTSVETASDALLSLMPPIVNQAIAEGLPVKRQGDLFFVPVYFADGTPKTKVSDAELTDVPLRARLKANAVTRFKLRLVRPSVLQTNHAASQVAPTENGVLVRGTVYHARREHPPVRLGKQWHLTLKNLAVQSWRVPRRGGREGD